MKQRATTNAALVLALALLAGLGWQWYRNRLALAEFDRWENHTHIVMLQLQELLSALTDAETGQRGFIITGTEGYLQPYNQALSRVARTLASLRSRTKDNPRQQQRLDAIEPLVQAKLAELKETIDLRRTKGLEAASQVVRAHLGRSLMDQLRQLIAQAQADEARLLKQRSLAKEAGLQATFRTALLGGLLSCALLLTAFLLLKQQQAATRTSEIRYRRLFEAAHDGVLLLDPHTHKIIDANPFMTHLLGYSREELLGQELWQLGLPRDAPAHQAVWQQLEQTHGHVRHDDLPLQTKSGQPREVEFVSNVYEEDGHSVIQCNIRDVTERKQMERERAALLVARQEAKAEAALRQSEERFRTMADAIPQLAWIAQADGYIFWYNRRWYEYTGTTPQQMEGWGWQSVHDPKVLPKVLEQWCRCIATGQPFDMEFPLRGADGRFRPFLTRVMPLKDNQGRVALWFGTNTDIAELKQAHEALRESEERLRFALETSHTGAWDLDLVDHSAFRSLEHDRIFGYAELLPQWTYEMFLQHVLPEDRAAVDAKFRHATATQGDWSFECRIRRADGKVRWIWAAGRYRVDAAGGMRRMAGIVQDVTERKEAEESLRQLKEELEVRVEQRTAELAAINRELEDFASIVSHDLKAPLRGVAALADWLQQDNAAQLDERGRQRLAQMDRRIARMNRMIEEILEYSRLGRSEEKSEFVPLGRLLPVIVQDLAPPPSAHIHIASDLPVVQGEPVRLRQVFQNLIGNAIKYADKPTAEIQVTWTDADSCWEFAVADNGPGIAEEHFERIFKMFQTLAPKDKTDSTGVGLALVKRIVEHAGGRAWVESRVGQGSTFHFTWPKGEAGKGRDGEPERRGDGERMAA